jgi:hypothetical protein
MGSPDRVKEEEKRKKRPVSELSMLFIPVKKCSLHPKGTTIPNLLF